MSGKLTLVDDIIAIRRRGSVSIGDNNKKRAIHIYKHVRDEERSKGSRVGRHTLASISPTLKIAGRNRIDGLWIDGHHLSCTVLIGDESEPTVPMREGLDVIGRHRHSTHTTYTTVISRKEQNRDNQC